MKQTKATIPDKTLNSQFIEIYHRLKIYIRRQLKTSCAQLTFIFKNLTKRTLTSSTNNMTHGAKINAEKSLFDILAQMQSNESLTCQLVKATTDISYESIVFYFLFSTWKNYFIHFWIQPLHSVPTGDRCSCGLLEHTERRRGGGACSGCSFTSLAEQLLHHLWVGEGRKVAQVLLVAGDMPEDSPHDLP